MDRTQLPSLLHYNDDGTETIHTSLSLAEKHKEQKNSLHPLDAKTIQENTINTLYYG